MGSPTKREYLPDAIASEFFISTGKCSDADFSISTHATARLADYVIYEKLKLDLMRSECLYKITMMKGEEAASRHFNNETYDGEADELHRRALWNAMTRYNLLRALVQVIHLHCVAVLRSRSPNFAISQIGKLDQCTTLTNDGLDQMLLQFTNQIQEFRTREWAKKVGPGGEEHMKIKGICVDGNEKIHVSTCCHQQTAFRKETGTVTIAIHAAQ
jgi:hypothetical protein